MSRNLFTIRGDCDRAKVVSLVQACPNGARVEIKAGKRSLPQNARLWAMLGEVSEQVAWHGIKLSPTDWKFMFLDSLKRELRMVPNIDNTGFVSLGRSSSDLTKDEMSDMIEIMFAFGAKHGVVFQDDLKAIGTREVAA